MSYVASQPQSHSRGHLRDRQLLPRSFGTCNRNFGPRSVHNTGDKTLSRYIKYSGFTVTYSVVRWHTITGSDVYASACGYVFLLSRV